MQDRNLLVVQGVHVTWFKEEGGSVSMEEQKDDKIKIHIEPDSFKISGKVPIGKKEIYILLAILAAAVGVSYEEIFSYMGVM